MNPFEIDAEEKLYCLATEKEATAKTVSTKDLGCIEIGKMWEDEFTNACLEDPSRFELQIPRRKIRNFNSDAAKSTTPEFLCPGIQILVYEDDTADISITNVPHNRLLFKKAA